MDTSETVKSRNEQNSINKNSPIKTDNLYF